MEKTLITGANGFVGSALCAAMRARDLPIVAAVRQATAPEQTSVGNLSGATDWSAALAGCSMVVHCAARVHVLREETFNRMEAYREVNVHAATRLARQAAAHGVRRFIFMSSVKVNGEFTRDKPFSADDTPAPIDPYGQSKLEAEYALASICAETGMQLVVIRPPLVYGPGVKANFLRLMKLVRSGLPLPFGRADNRRSMVALDNLIDFVMLCLHHPQAAGRTLMVSDGRDMAVEELILTMAAAMGRPAHLFPVPRKFLLTVFSGTRIDIMDKLFNSLQVDISATQSALNWQVPVASNEAVRRTVLDFLQGSKAA